MRRGPNIRRWLLAATLLPAACGPRGPTTSAFDGIYKGTGYSTNPGLPCANNIPLSPMKVADGHVEVGNIEGWVQPDGHLQTVFGRVFLSGQFQGTHFEGLVQNPQPACNYRLEMDRAS